MHSRRALLCIHFYGLESDFLLAGASGCARRADGAGKEGADGGRLDVNLPSVFYFLLASAVSITRS